MGDLELDPEDTKIVTLARHARARTSVAGGAAVRDTDGRTYAAADVNLPSLRLSALQLAVATAAASGALGLEAAALVTETGSGGVPDGDVAVVRDLGGAGVSIIRTDVSGQPLEIVRS